MDNDTPSNVTPINAPKPPAAPAVSDLTDELWREYTWVVSKDGQNVTYRIKEPTGLVVGKTTHRVIDKNGIVHCVPTVGERGCVLRWKTKDGAAAVRF